MKHVLAEVVWYFEGLDLGQSRDHSALAVVERAPVVDLLQRAQLGLWTRPELGPLLFFDETFRRFHPQTFLQNGFRERQI